MQMIEKAIDREIKRMRRYQMIGEIRKSKYKFNLFREIDKVIKEFGNRNDS